MAYVETTGLLEIAHNPRRSGEVASRNVGRLALLEWLAGHVHSIRAASRTATTAPLTRLSDRMLEDIGVTRAQAIELDRRQRRHQA